VLLLSAIWPPTQAFIDPGPLICCDGSQNRSAEAGLAQPTLSCPEENRADAAAPAVGIQVESVQLAHVLSKILFTPTADERLVNSLQGTPLASSALALSSI